MRLGLALRRPIESGTVPLGARGSPRSSTAAIAGRVLSVGLRWVHAHDRSSRCRHGRPRRVRRLLEDTVTAQDAYKIGCPAVDTAVAGGGLAAKAAVAGLKKLSESGQLDPEPQKWLDATISLLEADGDPSKVSTEAKQLIITGCADNGYELKNLK